MYSRESGGQTFTFEPSGGLLNASLVMQDRETDSYWSIMTEEAIHGSAMGHKLRKLPGAEKTTWGAWRARHPGSKVLSVDGVEHDSEEHYARYFSTERTFRGIEPTDDRLPPKELIYVFHRGGKAHAIPHASFAGGALVTVDGRQLFIYREKEDSFYRSTAAFLVAPGARVVTVSGGFAVRGGERQAVWNRAERRFEGDGSLVETFEGFDTFWYIWSLTNEGSEILEGAPP